MVSILGDSVLYILFAYRMSAEMVACIAVESLSILEKMHSKGYGNTISDELMNLLICFNCHHCSLLKLNILTSNFQCDCVPLAMYTEM